MSLPSMPPRPNRPSIPTPPSGSGSTPPPPSVPQVPPAPHPRRAAAPQEAYTPAPTPQRAPVDRPQPRVIETERREGGLTSKKPLLIGGGAAAGVLILAGGVFAYNALAPAAGGPEEAVPASALLFAKLDLDPSADQKIAFLQLKEKFPELDSEGEEGSIQETVAGAFFSELDYATEVEPWMGDRFAVGGIPNEADPSVTHMFAVYSVDDSGAAEAAASKISDPSYLYDDKYLVLSDTEESLEAWKADIESEGSLADSKDYRDDMNHLDGDLIASLWVDMEQANTLAQEAAAYGSEYGDDLSSTGLLQQQVKGSLVGGIHLEKNAVQAQFVAVGTGVESEIDLTNGSVSDVNNLPGDAIVAVAVANLDQTLTSVWAEYKDQVDEYTLEEIQTLGLSLPEDFTRLVGSQTTLGISGMNQETGEPNMMARLKGADESLFQQLAQDSGASEMANISKDGDTVILSTGTPGEGKLGDNENFKNAVPNRDKALMVAFLDIDAVMAQMGGPSEESYGYAGASASYDEKNDTGDLTIRWVFND